MRKFKKFISCVAATALAVTSLVSGSSLGASADTTLITNGGPYEGDATYIDTYMSGVFSTKNSLEIQFKYDSVGTPSQPVAGEDGTIDPYYGYNDTFEFLAFDTGWGGWQKTIVGPAGVDITTNPDEKPVEGEVYTVEVPISKIASKLPEGSTLYGINLQTGGQLGTSVVSIVSLKVIPSTTYVQPAFTIEGKWNKGTASEMTVTPEDAATVIANEWNIQVNDVDFTKWTNPTIDVTVTYAAAQEYVQAEIMVPTGVDENGYPVYEAIDPNYVNVNADTYTFTTEIPNITTSFIAAYDACTVEKIYVYDNTAGNDDTISVTGLTANEVAENMGLAWNLGNALDVVDKNGNVNEKGTSNAKTTKKLIQAVKAAGFNTIKIPISFMNMIEDDNTINDDYMARIQQVVDYAYDMGMYAIVSLHSDGMSTVPGYWLNIDKTGQEFNQIVNKYAAIWSDIATTFTGYDQRLVFQAANELMNSAGNYAVPPTQTEYDNINALDQAFVNAVRNAGGNNNAERVLSVVGYLNNIDYTIAGFKKPTDETDNRLMLCVNYYDPSNFTLGGYEGGNNGVTEWDEDATYGGKVYMEDQFINISEFAKEMDMPVMIGEYGPADKNNIAQRANYCYWLNYYAASYGIVTAYWDNGETGYLGTALFDRTNNVITTNGSTLVKFIKAGYSGINEPTLP